MGFPQSMAILRYVGRLTGLYPEDAVAAMRVDGFVDAVGDLQSALKPLWDARGGDKNNQEALAAKFMGSALPRYLGGIDRMIDGDFCVGDSVTIADVVLYAFANTEMGIEDRPVGIPANWIEGYERVAAVVARVDALP